MKIRLIKMYTLCALLGAAPFTLTACDASGEGRNTSTATTANPGGPANMLAQWTLPTELREVSSIALVEANLMACVQDEEGAIYLYDLNQKKVQQKISFAGPGDYEGIVLNGNTAFVLRSDGAILEVADFRKGKPKVTVHASVLAPTQNTEGLALDKKNNRLLIACKGYDEKLGDNKGIYAFSLEDKKMQPEPVITIPLAQEQLTATGKKKKSKYDVLQPSSLEIHPTTGELYLLDAVNNRLLTLDAKGKIAKAVNLDKNLLRQAEGLTFGSNGEMYIASEGGKKGKGVIIKYQQGL